MKVIDVKQRTPEWFKWRSSGVSASDAPILMGTNSHKTEWRLWAEKIGLVDPDCLEGNPHVIRGLIYEAQARRWSERVLEETCLLPLCVESSEYPVARSSLDGICLSGRPVEIKIPSQKVWEDVCSRQEQSDAYQMYFPQVQQQIWCTDSCTGYLLFFSPELNGNYVKFDVQRNAAFISRLRSRIENFHYCVMKRKEPHPDPTKDLFIPNMESRSSWKVRSERFEEVVAQIDQLNAELIKLKDEKSKLDEAFVHEMGEYLLARVGNVRVTQFHEKGQIDYKRIVQERLNLSDTEIELYRKPGTRRARVQIDRAAQEFDALVKEVAASRKSAVQ